MSNPIHSYPTSGSLPAVADAAAPAARQQAQDLPAPAPQATGTAGEAVTITDGARATAQLLDHARAADGVDHAAVAKLRTAIHAGSYTVSADALASAITSAFSKVKS